MDFHSIKFSETSGVSIKYSDTNAQGVTGRTEVDEPKVRPSPAFIAALAAFKPWVFELLGWPVQWTDDVTVTGIALSEGKGSRRQLQVIARRPIKGANNAPVVTTTPLMRAETENAPGASGTFDSDIADRIDAVIKAAVDYINGERDQTELALVGDPATTTRKERQKRGQQKEGYEVQNGTGVKTDEGKIRAELLKAGRDVGVDAIALWTSSQRDEAVRWAYDVAKVQAGTLSEKKAKKEPEFLLKVATPALLEEQMAGRAD